MSRQSILLSALAGVLVIALWWVFLYSPGQDDLASVQDEIEAAEAEQASLQQRIAALESVRSRAPETEAAIARLQGVVPIDPALPGALRQIAAAAEDAGMDIDALNVSRPVEVEGPLGLYAQTVTLTSTGSYFQLVDFIRRVENPEITSRGILFQNLTISPSTYPALTVSMNGQMFSILEPVPVPADEEDVPADAPADAEDEADDETSGGDADSEGDAS